MKAEKKPTPGDSPDEFVQLVAEWARGHGISTGHGENIADLLDEIGWQIKEIKAESARLQDILRCHHGDPCTAIVLRQDSEIQKLRAQLESQIEETQIAATGDILPNVSEQESTAREERS
jgi:hypothetical protein